MMRLVLHLDSPRTETWVSSIIDILVRHYFVRIVLASEWDIFKQKSLNCLHILGRKESVLMAEHVFDFLAYKICSLWDEAKREHGLKVGMRLSYQLGILRGFREKLDAIEKARGNGIGALDAKSEDTNALVRLERRDLDAYVKRVFPTLGTKTSSSVSICEESYSLGQKEGKAIVIHAPISKEEEKRSKPLLLDRG